jgi:hypothetical protein
MHRLSIFALLVPLSGCSDFSLPPKVIVADGQTYYACKGYVRSFQKTWGGETYTVEFQERDGRKVQLRGISKLAITSMPAYVWSEIPANLPDPKTAKEGSWVGDWNSPKKAILVDGVWQAISIRNPACVREKSDEGSAPATTPKITKRRTASGTEYEIMSNDADPNSSMSLAEWEAMTPAQQAAYKGVIDLPNLPK